MTVGDFLWGLAETAAGAFGASSLVKAAQKGVGMYKDFRSGMDMEKKLSGLATDIGDLKDGLDRAKGDIEAQGKALRGEMEGMKTELEGQLKQQGEKFDKEIKQLDAKIANATGQLKKDLEEEKKQTQAKFQQLQSQIQEVTENLTKAQQELRQELDDFKNDVEKRFEQQENKIRENRKRIEEEKKAREQEIKEVKDKISLARKETENLRQEKDDLKEDFEKAQHQTNRKMEEIQQDFEDYQAETSQQFKVQQTKYQQELEAAKEEFETKSRNLDAKFSDNQELLTEHEEDLSHLKYEQKKQNILNQELFENLQETNDILFAQQRKLNLVSQQMDDIQEEVHLRMDKISKELNQKTQETLNIAKDATRKVDKLTHEVQQMRDDLENIEDQIAKNKEETEQIKKQAKQTNQRIDNLLKAQALSDYSAEQSNFDKIQKSLELKAEEAKLLATLNLLKETKNLVHLNLDNKEWLVGIKKGTETEKKGQEGLLLDPNSSWAKKYTPEQLREWGWDTRLFGEHEKAQLLSEEADKKETHQEQVKAEEQEGENTVSAEQEVQVSEVAQQVLEEVNTVQAEILKKLQAVQEEINQNISEVESAPPPPPAAPKPSATTSLEVIKAESKVKIKKRALERQQKAEQEAVIRLKHAEHEAKQEPTPQNKKAEQLAKKQVQEEKKETQKAEKELQQAQEELSSLEKKQEFEEALEEKEKELEENQSEEINLQWAQIQALSVQALQESQDHEKPEETKEEELEKKLEELVQQLQEQEVAQAASQKTMTRFMLFLIIFLMEYVVYKKNGLPGLIILNIILLICYWYKDQIIEYWDLIGPYLLIIGYVAGNVLAYNSVDNPDYKMPMVYGFNAVVGLVYAYTYWQRLGGKQQAQQIYQQQIENLRAEFKVNTEEWGKIQAQSKRSEPKTWTEKITRSVQESSYNIYSNDLAQYTQELNNFQTFVQQREENIKKEEEMKRQAETAQKAAEMEQELKDNLEKAKENLPDDHPLTNWNKMAPDTRTPRDYQVNVPTWLKKWGRQRIEEVYPELKNQPIGLWRLEEYRKTQQYLDAEWPSEDIELTIEHLEAKETAGTLDEKPEWKERESLESLRKQRTKPLKTILDRLNKLSIPNSQEQALLSHLKLTLAQYITISLKIPYLTQEEKDWIVQNYLSLTQPAKFQLLNAGLNALEIDTYEKKEKLVQLLITLRGEKELFGLTTKEKENILRFLSTTLNLSEEQRESLEQMGISFFNASEWEITAEQKDHLLDFGLNRLELTEEQEGELVDKHPDHFAKFSLTGPQKNILNSLAPLVREDKYSLESLELLKSLQLKPTSQTFLVQEEIIPDPYTAFGKAKSSYLPLKIKFLEGEQKTLQKIKEAGKKKVNAEKIKENKFSILRSLMKFAQKVIEDDYLKDFNWTLEEWVKEKVITEWQKDILQLVALRPSLNIISLNYLFSVSRNLLKLVDPNS